MSLQSLSLCMLVFKLKWNRITDVGLVEFNYVTNTLMYNVGTKIGRSENYIMILESCERTSRCFCIFRKFYLWKRWNDLSLLYSSWVANITKVMFPYKWVEFNVYDIVYETCFYCRINEAIRQLWANELICRDTSAVNLLMNEALLSAS